jgi:threonine synthase
MLSAALCSRGRFVRTHLPGITKPFRFFATSETDSYSEADLSTPPTADETKTKLPPLPVTFEDVSKATFMIRSGIHRTPCDFSYSLSELCKTNVYLKKDFMQFTGSFKERGARYALLSLNSEERESGVVLASAGNHALAMAWHGK